MRTLITLLIVAVALATASTPVPAKKQDHPIALIGGTVHTVSGAVIEKGTVLFDNGKIIAVGTSVTLPPNVEKIDVTGKHVYPGLINAGSTIGLTEIDAVRATQDGRETGRINPNVRTEVTVNPESELIPTTRANGITVSHVIPSGGLIAGRTAAIVMDGWTTDDLTLKGNVGLYVPWPNMRINRAPYVRQSEEEQKKAIETDMKELRAAFDDARAYLAAKKALGDAQRTDLRWEAFGPLFEKKMALIVGADEVTQIEAAVQFAREQGVRLIIHGGRDSWKVADLLLKNNVAVIVEPIHDLPGRRWEEYDLPYSVPARLFNAGVAFAISGGGNSAMAERNMGFVAGTASSYGLPKEEALKAVTLNAAKVLGIEDRVGSIDAGKDATLIVTTGDPLEVISWVEQEYIQGKKVDLRSRHTELYEKYRERYKQLGIIK